MWLRKDFIFWATVCKMVRPMLSDHWSCLSVTLVYCGHTVGWIKMKLGPGHMVLDGDPAPTPPKGQSPSLVLSLVCLSAELGLAVIC